MSLERGMMKVSGKTRVKQLETTMSKLNSKAIKKVCFWGADHPHMAFCWSGRGSRCYNACQQLIDAGLAKFIGSGCIQFIVSREQVQQLSK